MWILFSSDDSQKVGDVVLMRTFITFHKILSAICANLYVSQGLVNCMQRCNDTLTACKFVSDSQEGQAHRNDIGTKFTTERW